AEGHEERLAARAFEREQVAKIAPVGHEDGLRRRAEGAGHGLPAAGETADRAAPSREVGPTSEADPTPPARTVALDAVQLVGPTGTDVPAERTHRRGVPAPACETCGPGRGVRAAGASATGSSPAARARPASSPSEGGGGHPLCVCRPWSDGLAGAPSP